MEKSSSNKPKSKVSESCVIFGENIRAARKKMGITHTTLGMFLGLSTAYVGLIERGERTPSLEVFIKICDFFGERMDDMLTRKTSSSSRKSDEKDLPSLQTKRQKMACSMISTFDKNELNYIITHMKSFKSFCEQRQNNNNCELTN